MKRFILFLAFVLSANLQLFSQKFTATEINPNAFPVIKINFVATNPQGQNFEDLIPSDFTVTENGLNVGASLQISCTDSEETPPIHVLLIADVSTSMIENPNPQLRRFNWLIEAIENFLNTLKFVPETKVAITAFSDNVKLVSDWNDNKEVLMEDLRSTIVAGVTRYDPPFLDPVLGPVAMFSKLERPDIKRVVIFLTDGRPDFPPKRAEITKAMEDAGISVYAITLQAEMYGDLELISFDTGGRSFVVNSKDRLNDIYELIAIDIQTRTLCELSWIAPYGCDEKSRNREVRVQMNRIPGLVGIQDREYVAPANSIQNISTSEPAINYGNPGLGAVNAVKKSFWVYTDDSPFVMRNVEAIPGLYFKRTAMRYKGDDITLPFTLAPNDSVEIEFEFTQENERVLRQAFVNFDSDYCPPSVQLVGGATSVILVSPNGGEVFSSCDEIDIIWTGVDEQTPVNVYYSTDGGTTRTLIRRNAVGNSMKWIPPFQGEAVRIIVEFEAREGYKQAIRGGGTGKDWGVDIAIQDNDQFLYAVGNFTGIANFSGNNLASQGNEDIYILKLDSELGVIWAESAGGAGVDTVACVTVDDQNNAYICGTAFQGARFRGNQINAQYTGLPYMYVAKYGPLGNVLALYSLGATGVYNNVRMWATGVRFNNGQIQVQGFYTNALQVPGVVPVSLAANAGQTRGFLATFNTSLDLVSIAPAGTLTPFKTNPETENDGPNIYATGGFINTRQFGDFTLTSVGDSDAFITKYGPSPKSEDMSNSNFKIQKPVLEFTINNVDVGQSSIGIGNSKTEFGVLRNPTDLQINILDFGFATGLANNFRINALPTFIAPKQEVEIEFRHTPRSIAVEQSRFFVQPECGDRIELPIRGEGVCTTTSLAKANAGESNINVQIPSAANCAFQNLNNGRISINPVIINDPQNEFEIVRLIVDGDTRPLGQSINLDSGQCVRLEFTFLPKQEGVRTASLDWGVQEGCQAQQTILEGTGIFTNLTVFPLDFQTKRIKTLNADVVRVQNTSAAVLTIDDVKFAEDGKFEFVDKASLGLPKALTGNEEWEIPIKFNPQTEGEFSTDLEVIYNTRNNTGRARIIGTSANPQLIAVLECDPESRFGTVSNPTLVLTNLSTIARTEIASINLAGTEYTFAGGVTQLLNQQIPQNGVPLILNLELNPNQAGARDLDATIIADIAEGNNVNADYPANETINYNSFCDVLSDGENFSANFGFVNPCFSSRRTILIENNSTLEELIIYANQNANIVGDPDGVFDIFLPNDLRIEPSSSAFLTVEFNPAEDKVYTASVNLTNNQDQNLVLNLNGTGQSVKVRLLNDNFVALEPGSKAKLSFIANVPNYSDGPLTDLKIRLKVNSNVVAIQPTITSTLNPWTWDPWTKIGNDEIEFVGRGVLPTGQNVELFEIEFFAYLGATSETSIDAFVEIENCGFSYYNIGNVTIGSICYLEGRLIDASNIPYTMQEIRPNPLNSNFEFEYSVGLDGLTTIELIDVSGNVLQVVESNVLQSGVYNATVNVNTIANGLYYLRMTSGPFVTTQSLIINK